MKTSSYEVLGAKEYLYVIGSWSTLSSRTKDTDSLKKENNIKASEEVLMFLDKYLKGVPVQ